MEIFINSKVARFLQIIACGFALNYAIYQAVSFSYLEWNARQWEDGVRGAFAYGSMCIFVVIIVIAIMYANEKQKQ